MENISNVIKILRKWSLPYGLPTLRSTHKEKDPFKTLIACLLSLRTQDKNTGKTSAALFKVADTPKKILKLPIKKLEKLIYSSGYYKNKARTIKHVSRVILEEYNGKVPSSIDELIKIKGIGRKTATITRVFGFGKADCIPTDVHVHVISNRLGWVKTKIPEQTEQELMKVIPKRYWFELNTLFVLFGKNVCITISPLCSKCPIRKYCQRIGVKRSR
jgi:endonuclease-3